MSEQATEPSVVEGCHLQRTPNGRSMTTVSVGGVIEARLFVVGWQFRPHWRRAMESSVPKRLAYLSPVSPNSWGCGSHE
jgi:hypothetical protein